MDFKNLGINDRLIKILNNSGIKIPTEIQQECIPFIKDGKDVIAEAQTGTGKTFAFLLPIFENISTKNTFTQALILAPTRELAIQISDEANKLKEGTDIKILAAYGGKDIGSQLNKLKNNIHIIIATPGRLLDHLLRKTVDLANLKTLVIDEADQMLLMGFKNEIEDIIKKCSGKRQTLCFSATIDSSVKKLAYRYMKDPITISVTKDDLCLESIHQEVVLTTDRWKKDALCNTLKEDNPFLAIIFCRTKRRADELEVVLHQKGFDCKKIHSDIPQNKRERIMNDFRNAKFQYLIATDVAARGLDITGVTHIYNYDIPETVEGYIHRIGRTGRANENGYTCVFIDPKNQKMLDEIENRLKFKIPKRILKDE